MKKLIIIAAVALMGAVANAAATTWSFTNLAPVDSGKYTMAAYLIDSSVTSRDTMVEALAGGNFSYLGSAYKTGTTSQQGTLDFAKLSVSVGDIASGVEKTFYTIILDATDTIGAKHFYATLENTATAPGTGKMTAAQFGMMTTGAYVNPTGWAEIAPEPTSGLMMLLGMGVLALRRRRA